MPVLFCRLFAAALLLPSLAFAIEREGIVFPDRIEVGGVSLSLNGIALRKKTIFKAKVYLAALYLTARSNDGPSIRATPTMKRLEIVFLREVHAHDIRDSWDEGLQKNCHHGCEVFAERLKRLKDDSIDVEKGQRILFTFYPDRFVLELANGQSKTYEGADFSDLILANFLGEPPSEEVKQGLLGILDPVVTDAPALTGAATPAPTARAPAGK